MHDLFYMTIHGINDLKMIKNGISNKFDLTIIENNKNHVLT